MSNLPRSLKNAGYDLQEAYFHRKERELIAKLRETSQNETEGAKVIELRPKAAAPPMSEATGELKKVA